MSKDYLLVVDVGNTHIVLGCYEDKNLVASWRIPTRRDATSDELAIKLLNLFNFRGLSVEEIEAAVIASVVPPITNSLTAMIKSLFNVEALVVTPEIYTGVTLLYDNPSEIGADRIANTVAGFELYGGPIVIVDFGTATTFDAVTERGEYLGGAIAPGIEISSEALFSRAARLSKVDLVRPSSAIGKNTASGIQSGLVLGTGGLVDRIVDCFEIEMGQLRRVVATGGLANLIAPECKRITDVDLTLTLNGLRIIYERNLERDRKLKNTK